MVEWMRHKDGGKMWFRRDKSQAGGMIGVIKCAFHSRQPQTCKCKSKVFKKTERNSGQLVLNKTQAGGIIGVMKCGFQKTTANLDFL